MPEIFGFSLWTGVKMSKVKSAIITAILVAAIIVLGVFAVFSWEVPDTNGTDVYYGFIGNIRLGSEFTGEAYTMLYPEGVISAADYHLGGDVEDDDGKTYADKYQPYGGLYVENDKIEDGKLKKDFRDSVAKDVKILAQRFGQKGASSYSVSLVDDCAVKITLASGFSYAAYKDFEEYSDSAVRSENLTNISNTIQYLIPCGTLDLKNGKTEDATSILDYKEKSFYSYFKSASVYSMAGTHAVQLNLTDEGYSKLNSTLIAAGSGTAYLWVGEQCLQLPFTMGSSVEDKTLRYTVTNNNKSYAEDLAIVIDSVINKNVLTNSFNTDKDGSGTQIIAQTSSFGKYAAIYLGVAMLIVIVASIIGNIVKYKELGIVCGLMTLVYALIMVTVLYLLKIELTMAGAFVLVLGLLLLNFSNIIAFEAIRKEVEAGRTVQAAVKVGYKKTLATLLDMHIVLVVVSAIIALACVGELAACGLIFFVASLASYVLYWFTRFMWYVLMSPAKDKFKFCGFKREVYDDED